MRAGESLTVESLTAVMRADESLTVTRIAYDRIAYDHASGGYASVSLSATVLGCMYSVQWNDGMERWNGGME